MHWEARLRELAHQQEGLVGRVNLREPDHGNRHWWRALSNGRWEALSPRVIRLRGSPDSDSQRALAAVLDASPGGFLYGDSTLAWFFVRGFDLRVLHVGRPYAMRGAPVELARLHRLRRVRAHDLVVARGVPTVTPLRAIWTIAERYASERRHEFGLERIGRILDDAHKAKLVTWASLHEAVGDLQQRGRAGTRLMRALADERPVGSSPTESRNEQRFEAVMHGTGLPPFRRQVVLGGDEPIGRIDLTDGVLPLALEINSLVHHTAPSDRAADLLRYRRLNEAGLTVGVVWEDDLWSDTSSVIAAVSEARRLAALGIAEVVHSASCPWPDGSHCGRRISR